MDFEFFVCYTASATSFKSAIAQVHKHKPPSPFGKKPVQRVLRVVGRAGLPLPCTFSHPNTTFIAIYITYICAFGRRRRCKNIVFKLSPKRAFGAPNCALRPFPFVLLRGPLRGSLVHVCALLLGGIPLCWGGWACFFWRSFSRDLRSAFFPYFFVSFALCLAGIQP